MINRHVLTVLLACLGIIAIISLQSSPKIAQVLAPMDSARNPVNTVQAFYKAVEKGEWLQARAYTTRECWNSLEAEGQVKKWQETVIIDGSFDFAGFSVDNSQIDQDTAIVNGRAVWLSAQGTVPRVTQTITLQQGLGGWRISSIEAQESARVVQSFYTLINEGKWEQAQALVQPEAWHLLESQGVITKLQKGFGKTTPYVTVSLTSVKQEGSQAQIQVDVVWTFPKETRQHATIKLNKNGEQWLIRQFVGGLPK